MITAQVQGAGYQSYATNFAPNGNITNKTDAGTYQYDPLKIHALAQLNSYNNVSRWNQDVVYTSFKRPEKITENSSELIYTYGADYERRKAVLNTNWATVYTRYYLGDYEMTTRNGVNQYVHYITGGDGVCAIAVKEGNSAFNFYVPYSDHLGSILTLTNTSGVVVAEQNFDAWGRKRNATTWDYANVAANPTWLYRGYTGHEQLPEFNLINMNARLYDPVLGRMLSPDNYVSIGGSQGLNRYTYAYNNPTKYSDPDGNCPICPLLIAMAVSGGIDLASQLYSNGGNWSAVDWSHVGGMAVIGGVSYGVSTVVAAAPLFSLSTPITQQVAGAYAGGFVQGLGVGISNGQTGLDLFGTATFSAGVGAVSAGVAGTIANKWANRHGLRNGGYVPSEPSSGEFPGVPNAAQPHKRVPYTVFSDGSEIPIPSSYSKAVMRIPDMVRSVVLEAGEFTYTKTAANHWAEYVKTGYRAGLLSRPYMRSPLMIQEIMSTGPGTPDAFFKRGLNWKVPGYFTPDPTKPAVAGIWELGLNPDTKIIYHFNFAR